MIPYRFMIIIVLILLTILGLHQVTFLYLQTSANELLLLTDQLGTSIHHQQWTDATSVAKQFQSSWKQVMPRWSLFLDHPEMDNIQMAVSKLHSYIRTNSREDALAELETVRRLIEHLPQKEQMTWKNIL